MPTDMNRLDELYAASTQGPWHRCQANNRKCSCGLVWSVDADAVVASVSADDDGPKLLDEERYANGDFIAEVHNAWPDISRRLALLEEFANQVKSDFLCHPGKFREVVCDRLNMLDAETKKAGE